MSPANVEIVVRPAVAVREVILTSPQLLSERKSWGKSVYVRIRVRDVGAPRDTRTTLKRTCFHQALRPRARISLWRLWTLRRLGASPLNCCARWCGSGGDDSVL